MALLLTTLVGCSEDKETLASWSENGGQKHMDTIGADVTTLTRVSDPIGADSTIGPRCSQMLDDVKAARAYGELPDKGAQISWEETLDRLKTAASHCLRNVKAGNGGASLADAIDVQSAFHVFADRIERVRSQS
ncbi:hypothetical protein ACFYO2_14235 [Streptomyces sp. NPDC006602]|uniref:hypothetical protein n=1 Tax=Streptomyces sp. NPDC006602 TaxID=3364751 RepID=UPI003686E616